MHLQQVVNQYNLKVFERKMNTKYMLRRIKKKEIHEVHPLRRKTHSLVAIHPEKSLVTYVPQ